jgi:RNA polymerase sigma factor (sigma-70 family)
MSFDDVYLKYYNELRRFGRQLNISADNSEDILQDTFLRFFLELKKNVEFNNPRAWLYKVYLNQFRTKVDRENRMNRNNEALENNGKSTGDIHEDYARNERHQIVIQMLNHLDKRDKEILLLYHNGFSYAEMAEILEINQNSVGKILVRAIDRLKQTLKIQYHEMFEQN